MRMNSSAPSSSTSDNATCATTSARRSPKRSRLVGDAAAARLQRRAGASAVARSAGATPNSRQATSATPLVNASTRQFQLEIDEDRWRCRRRARDEHAAQHARQRPRRATAPAAASSSALDHQLPDDAAARGADGEAHGDLALARARAREQQVGQVGAGDQQHQAGRRQQDDERLLKFVRSVETPVAAGTAVSLKRR